MHCKVNYSCQRSVSNTGLIWSVRLLGLPLNFLTCFEAASQLWPTICKTSLLESQMVMLKVFRRIFSSSRSTTWCYVSGVFIWNPLKLANNIYGSLRYYERMELHTLRKYSAPFQTKLNERLYGAYILAGFAVQRERIEGLAVFSEIAVECSSLLTEHGEY